jgi:hypothetical protein
LILEANFPYLVWNTVRSIEILHFSHVSCKQYKQDWGCTVGDASSVRCVYYFCYSVKSSCLASKGVHPDLCVM